MKGPIKEYLCPACGLVRSYFKADQVTICGGCYAKLIPDGQPVPDFPSERVRVCLDCKKRLDEPCAHY